MKVEKITEEYVLTEQDETYYVDFGNFKHTGSVKVTLRISEINANNFIFSPKCGCTSAEYKIIDQTTIEVDVVYNQCEADFQKTVELIEPQKTTVLKIKGHCSY